MIVFQPLNVFVVYAGYGQYDIKKVAIYDRGHTSHLHDNNIIDVK